MEIPTHLCSHLLARDGLCPCGWRAPVPASDPAIVEAWWDAWEDTWAAIAEIYFDARRIACRRRFSEFVREAWRVLFPTKELVWSWYLDAICDHIQWILEQWRRARVDRRHRQTVQKAAFNVPPGTAKTLLLSIMAPAWMWLDTPEWSVLCLSVNPRVSLDSASKSRDVIISPWYQSWFEPDWEMREDRDAASDFVNTRGGRRSSQGLSGQVIGARADAVLLDDPNALGESTDVMIALHNKFDGVLTDRVNDPDIAVLIVIQQRLDPDDLTGHILRQYLGQWMHFVLPMLFDSDRRCRTPMPVTAENRLALDGDATGLWVDPRAVVGECLSSIRFPPEFIRTKMATATWQATYQQDPDADEGEHFKTEWWRFWRRDDAAESDVRLRPQGCSHDPALVVPVDRPELGGGLHVESVWVTVDATNGSESESASEVGLLAAFQIGSKICLLHDEAPGSCDFLKQLAAIDRCMQTAVRLSGHRVVRVLIEEKALGATISLAIRKHVAEAGYQHAGKPVAVTVEDYNPGRDDKESRCYAMEPTLALHDVFLPEGAPWIPAFLREFRRFPKKPNDRVDALAQLVARLQPKPGTKYRGFAAASKRMFGGGP